MKKTTKIFLGVVMVVVVVLGIVAWRLYGAIKPAITKPPQPVSDFFDNFGEPISGKNNTDFPLIVSDNLEISLYAKNVPGVRAMVWGPDGALWVSQTKQGVVSRIDPLTHEAHAIFRNLNNPHGLTVDYSHPQKPMYIAEEHRIARALIGSEAPLETLVSIPEGGRHVTRSFEWTESGELLVSVGSACDACEEKNPIHGTIQKVNFEKKTLEPYATGLRNAVFLAKHPVDGSIWATEMGRDFLGDNLPPDEVNSIEANKDYGWPFFYGKNIRDQKFESSREVLRDITPSYIDLPAHVAPLGLGFIPEEGWKETWWYDLVVAYHGSWNSSDPVGYKLVRIPLDEKGKFTKDDGTPSTEPVFVDLVSGFLTADNRALGRPAGVLVQSGGSLLVSDDHAGVIYEIRYVGVAAGVAEVRQVNIEANATVASPLVLTGEAPGSWFFEADFPVELLDANGDQVTIVPAQAQGEWMTKNFVPFRATLDFSLPMTPTGKLIFHKNNPSGLPEHDARVEIPVVFGTP